MKRIAIEEHFWTEEFLSYLRSRKDYPKIETIEDDGKHQIERLCISSIRNRVLTPDSKNRLLITEERLKNMDESGIDMQVLSLTIDVEQFDSSDAIDMAKRTNDELSRVIKKYPERFAGFAAIPLQDPDAAANELERAGRELGLRGAKITSNVGGEYLDDEKYWVIFERAEKLGMPIYLHPSQPSPQMLQPYFKYPCLAGSVWGFSAETSLHAMRLIASGVFDNYPGLKIILGHLGEALPFWLWRIDNRWSKEVLDSKLNNKPSEYIKNNFLVTTSGMFWQPSFLCVYSALGADKILFAVDYPYETNTVAVDFMEALPISELEKEKIYHQNAERLLAL